MTSEASCSKPLEHESTQVVNYDHKRTDIRRLKDITTSLVGIVQYSQNERFKNDCFQVLNVNCTKALEEQINKKIQEVCEVGNFYFTKKTNIETPTKNVETTRKGRTEHKTEEKTWFTIAAQKTKKTPIKRKASSFAGPSLRECPSLPANYWSQPREEGATLPFETLGKASLSQLARSPIKGPSHYYGFSRQINTGGHFNSPLAKQPDRRNAVPEQTRRVLFLNQEDQYNHE